MNLKMFSLEVKQIVLQSVEKWKALTRRVKKHSTLRLNRFVNEKHSAGSEI